MYSAFSQVCSISFMNFRHILSRFQIKRQLNQFIKYCNLKWQILMMRIWHCSISARALWQFQPSEPKYSDCYHVTNSLVDTVWQTNFATDRLLISCLRTCFLPVLKIMLWPFKWSHLSLELQKKITGFFKRPFLIMKGHIEPGESYWICGGK